MGGLRIAPNGLHSIHQANSCSYQHFVQSLFRRSVRLYVSPIGIESYPTTREQAVTRASSVRTQSTPLSMPSEHNSVKNEPGRVNVEYNPDGIIPGATGKSFVVVHA